MLENLTDQNFGSLRLKKSRGQALVEYILLLVVVVGMILGIMNAFFTPGRDFLNALMGTYVECLIDYGELPFVGTGAQGAPTECADELSFAIGALTGGQGGGAGSNRSNQNSSDPDRGNRVSSSSPGSSGGGGGGGRTRRLSRSGGAVSGGGGQEGGGESSSSEQQVANPAPLGSTRFVNSGGFSGSSSGGSRQRRRITIIEMVDAEKKKIAARGEKVFSAGLVSAEARKSGNKKLTLTNSQRAAASLGDESTEWGFGKIFRIALIIVILILLVIVLGGQILQASKSGEK
jgi:hypothetical protein